MKQAIHIKSILKSEPGETQIDFRTQYQYYYTFTITFFFFLCYKNKYNKCLNKTKLWRRKKVQEKATKERKKKFFFFLSDQNFSWNIWSWTIKLSLLESNFFFTHEITTQLYIFHTFLPQTILMLNSLLKHFLCKMWQCYYKLALLLSLWNSLTPSQWASHKRDAWSGQKPWLFVSVIFNKKFCDI